MVRTRTQQFRTGKELYRFWHQRFAQAQLNQVSASLAYTTILAIVPMLSILTIFISKLLTLFGIGGLLLSAILTLMTIERAFNQVWQVKQQRPFLIRMLMYILVTALGPVLLGLSIYLTSYVITFSHDLNVGFNYHTKIIDVLVPFVLTMFPFVVLYKFGPNAIVQWRDALIGGILAAVVFESAKYGFTLFVSKAQIYKTLYGAFAIGPLFLVWIYLTWWVTMAGAVLTASLPHIRNNNWFTEA